MAEFNLSTKELRSSSTGDMETNPLNTKTGVDPTPKTPPSNRNSNGYRSLASIGITSSPGRADYGNVDEEFIEQMPQDMLGMENNLAAQEQDWLNKTQRTLSRGAIKGLYGAVDPIVTGVGQLLKLAGVEAGETLIGLDKTIDDALDKNLAVHESDLAKDATFGEKLKRFSTGESLVDSVIQFGLLGIGVGALVKGAGALALHAGGSISTTTLGGSLQTAGRLIKNPVSIGRIFGGEITTNAIATGLGTNLMEGRVMAEETQKELERLYAPILYSTEISKEVKDLVRANIADTGNKIIATNTLLAMTDMVGFSRILKFGKEQVGGKGGFWNYLLNVVKPVAPLEGVEELIQNMIQTDAEFQNIQDIEKGFKEYNTIDFGEGFTYTDPGKSTEADELLLWQADPTKASEIALRDAMGVSEYLVTLGTDHKALIEAISGLVGGGPQWMITGAPSAIANRKEHRVARDAESAFIKEAITDFDGYATEDMLTEVALNDTMETLEKKFAGTDKKYLAEVVENYALAKTTLRALENNRDDAFYGMLSEAENTLGEAQKAGEITSEEYERGIGRINKSREYAKEYKNLRTYAGASQLFANTLDKIAVEGAIEAVKAAGTSVSNNLSKFAKKGEESEFELNAFLGHFGGLTEEIEGEGVPEKTEIEKLVEQDAPKVVEEKVEEKPKEVATPKTPIFLSYSEHMESLKAKLNLANKNINSLKSSQGQAIARRAEVKERDNIKLKSRINTTNSLKTLNSIEKIVNERKVSTSDPVSAIVEQSKKDDLLNRIKEQRAIIVEKEKNTALKKANKKKKKGGSIDSLSEVEYTEEDTEENDDEDIIFGDVETEDETVDAVGDQEDVSEKDEAKGDTHIAKSARITEVLKENFDVINKSLSNLSRSVTSSGDTPYVPSTVDESVRRHESLKQVIKLIDSIRNMLEIEGIPSYNTVVNMLESAGTLTKDAKKGLQHYYSEVNKEPIASDEVLRTPELVDSDLMYKFTDRDFSFVEDQVYEQTIASYLASAIGIAWDGELVKNYDWVKQGLNLDFKVLNDEQWRAVEKEKGKNILFLGTDTEQEPLISMSLDQYQEAVKEGKMPEKYSDENVRPIQVLANSEGTSEGAVLGYVHTPQFLLKIRKKELDKKLKLPRKKALVANILLRDGIFAKAGKDYGTIVKGYISGRVDNIMLNKEKTAIAGLALGVDGIPKLSADVFKGDKNAIFTVLSSSDAFPTRFYPPALNTQLNKENKTISTPKYIKDNEKDFRGSVMVLLPAENSDFLQAVRLSTNKVSQDDFEIIRKVTTALDDNANTMSPLSKARNSVASPYHLQNMFKSLVHAGKIDKLDTPDGYKFELSYTDSGVVVGQKYTPPGIQMRKVEKEGGKLSLGTITFKVKVGADEIVELPYEFIGTKRTRGKNSYAYVFKGDNVQRDNLSKEMATAEKEREQSVYPYYNIRHYTLLNAAKKKNSGFLHSKKVNGVKKWVFEQLDGIEDIVLERTTTTLLPGKTLPSGDKNYFRNTIITVALGDNKSAPAKQESSIVKKNSEDNIKTPQNKNIKSLIKKNEATIKEYKNSISSDKRAIDFVKTSENKDLIKKFLIHSKVSSVKELIEVATANIKNAEETIKGIEKNLKKDRKALNSKSNSLQRSKVNSAYVQNISRSLGFDEFMAKFNTPEKKVEKTTAERKAEALMGEAVDENEVLKEEFSKEVAEVQENTVTTVLPKTIPAPEQDHISKNIRYIKDKIKQFTFKFKTVDNKVISSLKTLTNFQDLFNPQERLEMSKSIANIMYMEFLGQEEEEISARILNKIKRESVTTFTNNIVNRLHEARAYKKHLNTVDTPINDPMYRKTLQYIKGLKLILSSYKNANQNVIASVYTRGFNIAIQNLGYFEKVHRDIEQENEDEVSERLSYTPHSSLHKNPTEKSTARTKAKLATLNAHKIDVNGEIIPDTNIFGTPKYVDDVYITLLNVFSFIPNNNLDSKKELIRLTAENVSINPTSHLNEYFMIQLNDQFKGDAAYNNYTEQDLNRLNMVMNKDRTLLGGMDINKSTGRLMQEDFSFSHVFKASMIKLNRTLKNLVDEKDTASYIENILVPEVAGPLEGRIGVAKKSAQYVESIQRTYNQIGNFSSYPTINLLRVLRSFDENMRVEFPEKTEQQQLDAAVAREQIKEIQQAIAEDVAGRLTQLFVYMGMSTTGDVYNVLYEGLKDNKDIIGVNFTGRDKDTSHKLYHVASKFVNLIDFNMNRGDGAVKKNHKSADVQIKALVKHLFRNNLMAVTSSVIRIGSKLIGTYLSPTHTTHQFKKIKYTADNQFLKDLEGDAYSENSVVRNMLLNEDGYGELNALNLFNIPERAGLLSMWESDIDTADTPYMHWAYSAGSYLESIEQGNKETLPYTDITYTIQQGAEEIEHRLKARIAKFTLPTMGDKDTAMSTTGLDFKVLDETQEEVTILEEALQFYIDGVVTPEINRIVQTKAKPNSPGYGGQYIYSMPLANIPTIRKLIDKLDANVTLNTMFAKEPYTNIEDNNTYIKLREALIPVVKSQVHSDIAEEFQSMLKKKVMYSAGTAYRWKKGTFDTIKDFQSLTKKGRRGVSYIDTEALNNVLYNRYFGQTLMTANYQQLVAGDVADFFTKANENKGKVDGDKTYDVFADVRATYDHLGKRMAKEVSPGDFPDGTRSIRYVVLEEIEEISKHYSLKKKIKSMDSGSYTSPYGAIEMLEMKGEVDEDMKNDLNEYYEGRMSEEAIGIKIADKLAAIITKPRVVGNYKEDLGGGKFITRQLYIKIAESVVSTSKIPLNDKTNYLHKIYDIITQMEEDGSIVKIVPASGVKVGQPIKPLNLATLKPDKEGRYTIDKNNYVDVSFEDYAIQLDTSFKKTKKNKNSGQMENLAWNSVPADKMISTPEGNKPIRQYWENIIGDLADMQLEHVADIFEAPTLLDAYNMMMGLPLEEVKEGEKKTEITISSDERISNIIQAGIKAFRENDPSKADNTIFEWLEINDRTKKFRWDLSASPYYQTFLDVLRKTVEKNTVAVKRSGKQLILESDVGYDLREAGVVDDNGNILGSGILLFDFMIEEPGNLDEKTGRLKPQLINDGINHPAQLLSNFNIETINNGAVLKMPTKFVTDSKGRRRRVIDTSALPKEALEAIGYRTPTQDYGMMTYAQVVGFLPSAFKGAAIAPKEFIEFMGSDFDVDKLFLYNKELWMGDDGNIKVIDLELAKSEGGKVAAAYLRNEKMRILTEILNDSGIITDHISTPLEQLEVFDKFTERIMTITGRGGIIDGKTSYLSPVYQEEKRNNAAGAKTSIGVFALTARVSAMLGLKPMPLLQEDFDTKELSPETLYLGNIKITDFGGARPSVFLKSKGAEAVFDLVKNNISIGITFSVDDENMHMLSKLGITDDTQATNKRASDKIFNLITNMLLARFRLKTGVAMANLPLFNAKILGKKITSQALRKAYNDKPSNKKQNKSVEDENLKPNAFTWARMVSGRKIDELQLINELNDFNVRLQEAVKEGSNITNLSNEDILNGLRLINFKKKLSNAYNNTISNFRWVFNMDSKGFPNTAQKIRKALADLNDEKYAGVVTRLREIKEIDNYISAFEDFAARSNILTGENSYLDEVYNILGDSDIDVDAVFDIQKYIRNKKYHLSKPNQWSLFGRLKTILYSTDPQVQEFRDNNAFLSRLSVIGEYMGFQKDEKDNVSVITEALEQLSQGGEIAGIDLKVLHQDLIDYGITDYKQTFGNSYIKHIRPIYYDKANALGDEALDKFIEPQRLAAYIAYKNIGKVSYFSDRPNNAGIWKQKVKDEADQLYYITAPIEGKKIGIPKPFTAQDAEDFSMVPPESMVDNKLAMFPEGDIVGSLSGGDIARELDMEATAEKILSSRSLVAFKKMFLSIFNEHPTQKMKAYLSNQGNVHFDDIRGQLVLSGGKLTEMRQDIIHEGTHMALQHVEELKQTGELVSNFPGKSKESLRTSFEMASEIDRVLENLDSGRKKAITIVEEYVTSYIEKFRETEKEDEYGILDTTSLEPARIVSAVLDTDSTFIATENLDISIKQADFWMSTLPPKIQKHIALEGRTQEYKKRIGFLNALVKGDYEITPDKTNKDIMALHYSKNDVRIFMSKMSKERESFYDIIKAEVEHEKSINKGFSTADAIIQVADNVESDYSKSNKERTDQYRSFLYGLGSLSEFMSQSYAMGSGNNITRTILPDYVTLTDYKALVNADLPAGIGGIMAKVFDYLRRLVRIIVGGEYANTIFKDVLYLKTLVNRVNFVTLKNYKVRPVNFTYRNPDEEFQDAEYTVTSEEILNICP